MRHLPEATKVMAHGRIVLGSCPYKKKTRQSPFKKRRTYLGHKAAWAQGHGSGSWGVVSGVDGDYRWLVGLETRSG